MKSISDECFLVSARSLSEQATAEDLKAGCLFPALENIRAVSAKVGAGCMCRLNERCSIPNFYFAGCCRRCRLRVEVRRCDRAQAR